MDTEPITIYVDPQSAGAYRAASQEDRQKLDLLLAMRLRDATGPAGSLEQIMRQISQEAQARGLTPQILSDLLNDHGSVR
ncbi:MAG: hypothetical protein K8T91_11670 [Planctomycetes bacterium]|nr:hypothetical protein [Planctomycetota bacterium]